jgi:multiple sugar transport system substrate-binding protein
MKRLLSISCLFLFIAAFAFAGSNTETAPTGDSGATTIEVTMEGYAGDFGTIEDIQANLNDSIENGDLAADALMNTKWKLDYLTTLAEVSAEKGVEWVGLDWGWAEQLTQKQMNAFLAETGPDVLVGETQMPGFAFNGYLLPFPADLEQKVRDTVVKGAYGPMEVDGQIYGLATYPGVNVLFWNKDILRKAGLDPDKGPETWSEWLDMCEQITAAGNGDFYGGGTYAGPNFGGSLRVGPFLMMAGGGFVDAQGNAAFDSPGNVEALTFMRELSKNSPPGAAAGASEGGWWDALNQGKIAFVVDGPWRLAAGTALGMDIGYSVLPVPEGRDPANVTIGAAFYGVPTYAENPAAAFAFIESLIDKRVQDLVIVNNNRPPVLKAYENDAEFMDSYMATFFKALQGDVSGLPTYKGNQNAKIWDVFHQHMTEAIITNGDIGEILGRAQALAERYENE